VVERIFSELTPRQLKRFDVSSVAELVEATRYTITGTIRPSGDRGAIPAWPRASLDAFREGRNPLARLQDPPLAAGRSRTHSAGARRGVPCCRAALPPATRPGGRRNQTTEEAEMMTIEPGDLKLVITGGARGIGAATARLLAPQGAKVLVTDVLDEEGEALAAELGEGVHYRRLDVTSEEDWAGAVAEAESAFGGLNALFNNAGILGFGKIHESAPDEFRRILDVNVTGCYLGMHACAPAIKRSGGGVVVNCSSTAGLQGYGGLAAYVTSKWALRGMNKAAALDLAPDGIRVLSLHPGPIRTPMTDGMAEDLAAAQPIPRFGEPEEVARMVRFMICEASYSTGTEFVVDGGAVTGQVLRLQE
jgi:3alpha(or 20beta)-hydroxysteroid dehydrogenase